MRSPGERIVEILQRFKEDEIPRAEALGDILRVLRSTCENCNLRKTQGAKKQEDQRKDMLEDIEGGF